MRFLFLFCLVVWGSLRPEIANAVDITIEEWKTSNGMRVILLPNPHQQAISHRIWFGVGAADDPEGRTGLAHFVEHMMFSGTPKYPGLSYSEIIAARGGQENAFTSWDYTAYHALIAKEHLPKVMELEVDRLQNVQLSDAQVERERNVILEERASRVSLSPDAKLREQMYRQFRVRHPYRRPIIGWNEDIKAVSVSDLQRFYLQYMHPANMTLVVAGNMSRGELEPMVEKYYGSMAARAAPTRNWLKDPVVPVTESQVVLRDVSVQQPVMTMLFHIPSMHEVGAEQAMGYYIAAHLLGGGRASLLHKKLVEEQQLAVNVGAYADPARLGPAEFMLRVVPRQGVAQKDLEKAVLEILKRVTFEASDLELAKDMLSAEKIYALDGVDGIARWVGEWVSAGLNVSLLTDWDGWLKRTTLVHVQDAMARLRVRPAVTGWLLPEGEEHDA